jgi:hypothetical protein
VNYWLLQNGFSIGIGDSIVDMATMDKVTDIISKAKNRVRDLIQLSRGRQLEAGPGQTALEAFENQVNQAKIKHLVFIHMLIFPSCKPVLAECLLHLGIEQGP